MKLMKDADIDMDDNMKKELGETLSKKRMKMMEEDGEAATKNLDKKEVDKDDTYAEQKFKEYNDDGSNKRRVKEK
jgi:hypothetical protein